MPELMDRQQVPIASALPGDQLLGLRGSNPYLLDLDIYAQGWIARAATAAAEASFVLSALVARMPDKPSSQRQLLMLRLIAALIGAGIWAKLDALYILAAPDAQAARLNWIGPSYGLTEVNSPTFTANSGYASDGGSSYLRTGFTPSIGSSFQQNSASFGAYFGGGGRRGLAMGAIVPPSYAGSHIARYAPENGGYCTVELTEAGYAAVINYNKFLEAGLVAGSRSSAASAALYMNGALVETAAHASYPIPQLEFYLLAVNVGTTALVNSTETMCGAFMGGALTPSEMAALHATLRSYFTAVGV